MTSSVGETPLLEFLRVLCDLLFNPMDFIFEQKVAEDAKGTRLARSLFADMLPR